MRPEDTALASGEDEMSFTEELRTLLEENRQLREEVDADKLTKREQVALAFGQGDWATQSIEKSEWPTDVTDELLIRRSRLYFRKADAFLKVSKEKP